MKRIVFVIVFVIACFITSSKAASSENEDINEKKYARLEKFVEIRNESLLNLRIVQADEYSFYYDSENSIVDNITIEVQNGVLVISQNSEKTISKVDPLNVLIKVVDLQSVVNEGVGSINIVKLDTDSLMFSNSGIGNVSLNLTCDHLSVVNEGVGKFTVTGSTNTLSLVNEGVGEVDLKNMISAKAFVRNEGMGKVSVFAQESIEVENDGLGNVRVFGNPSHQNIHDSSILDTDLADTSISINVAGDVNLSPSDVWVKRSTTKKKYNYTDAKFGIRCGFNNYLENGKLATNDMYKVKPGSMDFTILLGASWKIAKWFDLDYGISFSWYNFKYRNENIRYNKDTAGVESLYTIEERGYKYLKSKTSVPYINFELAPKFNINENLSIFVGGYAGYRIGGRMKYKVEFEDSKIKSHEKVDCFESIRYGLKAGLTINNVGIYATYDFSNFYSGLQAKGNEIKVTPLSFGICFNLED